MASPCCRFALSPRRGPPAYEYLRKSSLTRRRKIYPGPARFGQANRDRLLRRSRAVLAFANVFHLLTHKFTRLRARRFAFSFVFFRSFDRLLFRH